MTSETRTCLLEQVNDPVCLALEELSSCEEAVSLARIAAVARKEVAAWAGASPSLHYQDARNVCLDAYAMLRDALDDEVYGAAQSHDLERDALPSTAEIIDMLSKGDGGCIGSAARFPIARHIQTGRATNGKQVAA